MKLRSCPETDSLHAECRSLFGAIARGAATAAGDAVILVRFDRAATSEQLDNRIRLWGEVTLRPSFQEEPGMKLHYYPETDSLYVEFKAGPGAETREVSDGLNVDLDAEGGVVGFDIDHASRRLDLSTLETEALPVRSIRAR